MVRLWPQRYHASTACMAHLHIFLPTIIRNEGRLLALATERLANANNNNIDFLTINIVSVN